LQGETLWDFPVLGTAVSYIGIAIIKWLIFSLILYFVGVKISGGVAQLDIIASAVAFAYAPVGLQIFMPLFIPSADFLSGWPMIILFLTDLWMMVVLILGIKRTLDMPITKATGVVLLAGSIYWLVNYVFLIPTLKIPGIQFTVEPLELTLFIFSASTILATFLGVFTRPEKRA